MRRIQIWVFDACGTCELSGLLRCRAGCVRASHAQPTGSPAEAAPAAPLPVFVGRGRLALKAAPAALAMLRPRARPRQRHAGGMRRPAARIGMHTCIAQKTARTGRGSRSAACLAAVTVWGHATRAAAPCSTCARSSAAWRRPSGAARRRGRPGRPWRPRRALAAARAARRRRRRCRCQTPRMRCVRLRLRQPRAQSPALQRPADGPWRRPARCQTSTAVAAPPWCHWSAARRCATCARALPQIGC